MRFLFFIFFLLLSFNGSPCAININSIIFISESLGDIEGLYFENCSKDLQQEVKKEIFNFEGKTRTFYFFENLMSHSTETIEYLDKIVDVINLEGIIKQSFFNNSSRIEIREIPRLKGLLKNEIISKSFECLDCGNGQENTLKLNLKFDSGKNEIYSILFKSINQVKALKVVKSIPPFSDQLKKEWFEEIYIDENAYLKPFMDLDNLDYYSSNKPLLKNDILKSSDLSPKIMVRAGNKTEIILENPMVKIKTFGLSRSSGTFGQLVDVYHPEKKKNYLGKAIGLNKVMVEL